MGDLPKAPDDATWSDVERTFFDAAPPEEFQPVGPAPPPERPRTQIIASLRSSTAGARRAAVFVVGVAGGLAARTWYGAKLACRSAGRLVQRGGRGIALTIVATGVRVRHTARVSSEHLVAALLSIWCVDRRRLGFAMVGTIVAAGLSAGVVASRRTAPPNGAIAEREAPATGPAIAEAEPNPPPNVRPSADVQAPRADVPNRRSHAHRRSVSAAPPTQRPMVTAFMDRETYWAHETRSAPARSGRSFFSR